MALARWQRTITTGGGIIVPSALVEVRRESDNGLAILFSDRAGTLGLGNPFAADLEGFAAFHVIGGVYKITVTSGAFTRTWRYVGIGTTQEFDVEQLALAFANLPDLAQAQVYGRPAGAGTGDPGPLTAQQIIDILNTLGTRNFATVRLLKQSDPGEGGEIQIERASTSTLVGDIIVDNVSNNFRIFEGGGSARGVFIDLTQAGAGASLDLIALASTSVPGRVEYATAAEYRANTPVRGLDNNDVWASADYVGLADAATIAVDMSAGYNFILNPIAGNRTLGNPSATKNGQTGCIRINQDSTGNRTLAFGANWDFAAGAAPALSTAPNARDALFYQVESSTSIIITGILKGLA